MLDLSLNTTVDGEWGIWSSLHHCSLTCGGGIKERTRQCNNPPHLYGGQQCPGDEMESRDCSTQNCPGTLILTGFKGQRPVLEQIETSMNIVIIWVKDLN